MLLKVLLIAFLYSCLYYPLLINARNREIIWEQDFCPTTEAHRLSETDTYLPFNGDCNVCISDVLIFVHNKSFPYDNLYRVKSREAMENCNATNAINSNPVLFDSKVIITIANSGSSDFYNFFGFQTAYFISTSNGTEASAKGDKSRDTSCLQLSFTVQPKDHQLCNTQNSLCTYSTLNDSSLENIGCRWVDPTLIGSHVSATVPLTTATVSSSSSSATASISTPEHTDAKSTSTITPQETSSVTSIPTNVIVTHSSLTDTSFKPTPLSPLEFLNNLSIGNMLLLIIGIILIALCFIAVPCIVIYSLFHILSKFQNLNAYKPSSNSSDDLNELRYSQRMFNNFYSEPQLRYPTVTSFLEFDMNSRMSRATSVNTDRDATYINLSDIDFLPKSASQINNRPNHSTTNSTVYSV